MDKLLYLKSDGRLAAFVNRGYFQKVTFTIGDNTTTDFDLTLSFSPSTYTRITTTVYDLSTYEIVYPDIQINTSGHVFVSFSSPPTTNQYRVVMIGY